MRETERCMQECSSVPVYIDGTTGEHMKLWTVQPIEVYEQLTGPAGYHVDLDHPDAWGRNYGEAYSWLHDRAVERGLSDNGSGLIWCWYRYGRTRRKPDVRSLRKKLRKGSRMCCLTLEVPDGQVLLIDSDQWFCRMLGYPCSAPEEDGMGPDELWAQLEAEWSMPEAEQRRHAESTWNRVFDISRAADIEAVFFGLEPSMVRQVQFFTGEME